MDGIGDADQVSKARLNSVGNHDANSTTNLGIRDFGRSVAGDDQRTLTSDGVQVGGEIRRGGLLDSFTSLQAENGADLPKDRAGSVEGTTEVVMVESESPGVAGKMGKLEKMVIGTVISFITGCFLAIQASFNGALAVPLKSGFGASTISFTGGVLTLLLMSPFSLGQKKKEKNGKPIPWYLWVGGGALGTFYITSGTFLGPRLGYSLFFVATLFGQLGGSLVVDHAGWLDMPKQPLMRRKFLAVFLVLLGALLSVVENFEVTSSPGLVVLYFIVSILSGVCTPVQVNINTSFTKRFGTFPHRTALLSFFVGLVIISSIWGIALLSNPSIRDPQPNEAEWWMFLGGCLGACYLFATVALVPGWVSVPLFFISVTAGQLTFSLLIDGLGLFNANKVNISLLRYIGVILVFVGVAVYRFLPDVSLQRRKKPPLTQQFNNKDNPETLPSFRELGEKDNLEIENI